MNRFPNIVVILCHDLGQHLGCYGASGVRSSRIDAFAETAIRFKNSFCTAPQCSPSRAALWTGRFPHSNGVVGLTHSGFANDLNPDERHLAEILRYAGYSTHLFGTQHEARTPERCGYAYTHSGGPCGKIADDFAGFIIQRESSNRPLFAQIGFFETHRPFPHDNIEPYPHDQIDVLHYLPDIPEVREDLSNLEASVASVDKAFGRIIESICTSSIAENTIILFTSDHGIAFPHAKMTLYDPGIEVPLILKLPETTEGMVLNDMISNVDILPTLLDLIGLSYPPNLQGRSFAGLLTGKKYVSNSKIFAEKTYHTYYDPMRCIRTEQWKLIANFEFAPWQETPPNTKGYAEVSKALQVDPRHPPFELYDLQSDPYEQNNLADRAEHEGTLNALIRSLRSWMEETSDPLLDGPMAQGAYLRRMEHFKNI